MATGKRRDGPRARDQFGVDAAPMTRGRWLGVFVAAAVGVAHVSLYAALETPTLLFVGGAFLLTAVAVPLNGHRALLSLLGVTVAARRLVDSVGTDTHGMEAVVIDRPVRTLLVLVVVARFASEDDRVARRPT